MSGRVPDSPVGRRVAAAFYPPRSGDVILVQQPFWYLDSTPDGNAAMHGSPHGYDTHVPLMFAGPGIEHRVVRREVAPRDLAPTLAGYLGIPPPSVSMGKALPEVLD
jgi:arylsulfatase A-like enzyme